VWAHACLWSTRTGGVVVSVACVVCRP
jgi:hypothetical protein